MMNKTSVKTLHTEGVDSTLGSPSVPAQQATSITSFEALYFMPAFAGRPTQ